MSDWLSPIFLPNDCPVPANLHSASYRLVPRGQFEQAEMAAFDELPRSLRKLLQHHNVNVILQLLVKGLEHDEFSEDEVAKLIFARSAPENTLRI